MNDNNKKKKGWLRFIITLGIIIIVSMTLIAVLYVAIMFYFLTQLKKIDPSKKPDHAHSTPKVTYESTEVLSDKLRSNIVKYSSINKLNYFNYPSITVFNKNKISSISVNYDKKMIHINNMFHLYGDIKINTLIKNSEFKCLKIDNAQINLIK